MDYSLNQRGRASIAFLSDLRGLSDRFEARTDQRAREAGIDPENLPDDPEQLQAVVAPVLEADPEFRVLRMCRDWTLEQHGKVAMDAFEEIRDEVEPRLQALGQPSVGAPMTRASADRSRL